MARHTSATVNGGFSTFLLEVAFDRAGVKRRLAAALVAERTRRGGGDARRFPQPEMARELGYSLRQYQRLEDPDDPNLPSWKNVEAIAEKLGLDTTVIFDDGVVDEQVTPSSDAETIAALREEVGRLQQEVQASRQDTQAGRREVKQLLERVEALLETRRSA